MKNYLWAINQIIVLILLLKGIDTPTKFMGFLTAHGIVVFLTFQILVNLILTDRYLKSIISKRLLSSFILISVIPLIGPAGSLLIGIMLKAYPVRAVPVEEFLKINRFNLETYPLLFVKNPEFNPRRVISQLIAGVLPFHDALHIIYIISEFEWSIYKTRLLKLFLKYSPHPSVTIEVSRLLADKMNELLDRIDALERVSPKPYAELAELYYEFYELDLAGRMGDFYLEKACEYIKEAIKENPDDLELLIMGIKYYIEKFALKESEEFILQARKLAEKDKERFTEIERLSYIVETFKQGRLIQDEI